MMTRRIRLASRTAPAHERGAVAVVMAICVVVMFGMAALAVDVGNTWSQRREVQSAADLAAFAGGAKLPASTTAACEAAASAALDNLRMNPSYAQDEDDDDDVASWDLDSLMDDDAASGYAECPTKNKLRIVSPPSTVDFGFAPALGYDTVVTNADATVEITSPGTVAPLWLPADCATGYQWADVPSGPTTPSAATTSFNPALTAQGQGDFPLKSFSPQTFIATSTPTTMVIEIKKSDWPGGKATTTANAVLTLGDEPGVLTTAAVAEDHANVTVTFTIPTAVSTTPGQYEVWVVAGSPTAKYSTREATKLIVQGPGTSPPCPKDSGNFHKLDSPRAFDGDTPTAHEAIARNISLGLDHPLAIFEPASARPADGVCASGGSGEHPVPYAIVDKLPVPVNPANCIKMETGGSSNGMTEGLITGGTRPAGAYQGRMFNAPTSPACSERGVARPSLSYIGLSGANNDVLSCFMPAGVTIPQLIAGTAGPVLDDRIYNSPRFMWMPLVADDDFNGTKFEALSGYAPAFITNEGLTGADANNGIYFNGGGNHVDGVSVIALSPNSLPATTPSGTTESPYLGVGPKLVHLVD